MSHSPPPSTSESSTTATSPRTFHPCAVIPIYNHGSTIGAVVRAICAHHLPCLVIDDGSDAATRDVLDALAAELPLVTVVHLPVNGGKGAACRAGLRLAANRGYSHALQIDADGQHRVADVPRFLEAAEAWPEALILGRPVFDKSVPRSRFYLRYLTHWCVWLEILSFAVRDTMCGFRVYPLGTNTLRALASPLVGDRMDFDTAIVVRLYWLGLSVINVPTAVTYAPGGVSHFRLVRDNLHNIWLHTRLITCMLPRLPWLLFRSSREIHFPIGDWLSLRERGSALGLRFTLLVYRLLGHFVCTRIMLVVVIYFWLTSARLRQSSRRYFTYLGDTPEGRAALGRTPTWRDSLRQTQEYGYALIDKFAAWMNRLGHHDIRWENRVEFHATLQHGRGAILLSGHIGNIEVMRALSEQLDHTRVTALMLASNARHFNGVLREVNGRADLNLIATDNVGVETALLLKDRLDNGEIVALMGDRLVPGSRGRDFRVPFLGHDMRLPQGPFVLASLLDRPVYLMFCVRTGYRRYEVVLEKFADTMACPRAGRIETLQGWARRYADKLAALCYRYPHQWFNFHDVWE